MLKEIQTARLIVERNEGHSREMTSVRIKQTSLELKSVSNVRLWFNLIAAFQRGDIA